MYSKSAFRCCCFYLFFSASIVTKVCYKIAETLNNISDEHKDSDGEDSDGLITVQILSEYGEQ